MLRTLAIITTLRCDLKCAHCLRDFPKQRPDFPLELLPRLLMEAKPFGAKHIALTGGEPHLHPQFDQMVDMVVAAGYTWSFVSHGGRTQPYEPLLERFGENLSHISLSIDGATADIHDEIRRKAGAFERVTAAARRYVEMGLKVKMSTSLNTLNKHQLEDFVQLAQNLGVSHLMIGGTIPTPWNEDLQLNDDERLALYEQVSTLQHNSEGLRITYFSSLHTRGGINFCNNLTLWELTFNSRGELMFCCDTHSYGAVIGALSRQPLGELIKAWLARSNELQHHRTDALLNGRTAPDFDTCAFCNHYFVEQNPLLVRA